ncbi:MAG: M20/M25/M40 family metallo-hydrolase, partial [Prevotella sp.]|nr:M20/M25/M40 family metallo-hydrolase [Prevotella sp.]
MENLNYTNDAVMLLKDLIAIPSISRNEEKAADKLAEYLNLWHLPFGREGNNLWVGCPDWDNNRPTVMLNAHIDTVKPVSSWTRDPFQPMQEGDMLYGLGANDCGGGLVALLQTYRIMLERPRNYNILWVASAEEEV